MDHDAKLKQLLSDLTICATNYEKLLNISICLESNQFVKQKTYIAKFHKDNFLHLTGVKTSVSACDFFEKCLAKNIQKNDIKNFAVEYKSKIAGKITGLKTINKYFNSELYVQEDFNKNKVNCNIATSDNCFTIGFVLVGKILLPKTILNKNKLDKSKPILTIKPKTIQLKE